VKTVDDVAERKRGDSNELTMLFVSMARAAGLKAYLMAATSRQEEMFNQYLTQWNQMDTSVAIVNVGGKDEFFDPGTRYCSYGQLRWDHTGVGGVRQTDAGTAFATTPEGAYTNSKTVRVAQLTMDENGEVEGTVKVGYTGDPALAWRQRALTQDEDEVKKEIEEGMRDMLPGGLTVTLDKALDLDDPTKQLVTSFQVHGPLATTTSKRLFVPMEIFEAQERPLFAEAKRETPIYFHYGYQDVDQVSLTYPASMEVESAPKLEEVKMRDLALAREGSSVKGNTITMVRTFAMGPIIFKVEEYDELRSFYAKVNHKDQEQAILKAGTHAAGN
jgi:hypothetical protein